MSSNRHLHSFLLLAALLAGSGPGLAATKVGTVLFTRGAVSAQDVNKQLRLLGRRAPLHQGDIITTGPKSFAVFKLEDGGRMSLRPNTVFTVKHFSQKKSAGSLIMNLFKGGMRMISGLISKRNPNGVKLSAAGVTIGIRGTEFDARICDGDCNGTSGAEAATRPAVIGRVALMKGSLNATGRVGEKRLLSRGAPLYEGDALETGRASYAVIAMSDRGRFTLKPDTIFRVDLHRFNSKKQQKSSLFGSAFSLLKGGVRVLTGLIAKTNRKSFSIRTSQATIGIRGTGFDVDDQGPCTSAAPCGVHVSVWKVGEEGQGIVVNNNQGSWALNLNQSAKIEDRNRELVMLKTAPVFNVPRPDMVKIDFDKLFTAIKAGVYLSCHEGHCSMSKGGKTVEVGKGESLSAPDQDTEIIRFGYVQDFQFNDIYLQTINQDILILHELSSPPVFIKKELMCTVQS